MKSMEGVRMLHFGGRRGVDVALNLDELKGVEGLDQRCPLLSLCR